MLKIEVKGGGKICVPESINRLSTYVLFEQEDWFEDEMKFVRCAITPGMRVIDIGANYGLYTNALANCVTSTGSVWSIEPASSTVEYLANTIRENGYENILLLQAALSDRIGKANLSINPDAEINSLILEGDAVSFESVDLLTLDHCAREYQWHDIDFIKLDAEGEESRIINGGREFLAANSPLVMFELRHGSMVNHALIDQFSGIGYTPYRLLPGLRMLGPLDEDSYSDISLLNVFCCRQDRAADLAMRALLTGAAGLQIPRKLDERMHWSKALEGKAYYSNFRAGWDKLLRRNAMPGWGAYSRALVLYQLAHSDGVPCEFKGPCLSQSRLAMEQALNVLENLPRQLTYARILHELGRRDQVVGILGRLQQQLDADGDVELTEPFLPICARFDSIAIESRQQAAEWCKSSVVEQYERLHAWSSFYMRDNAQIQSTLHRLNYLVTHSFSTPEMERRRQLMLLQHGYKSHVELTELLTTRSAENLNARLWAEGAVKV